MSALTLAVIVTLLAMMSVHAQNLATCAPGADCMFACDNALACSTPDLMPAAGRRYSTLVLRPVLRSTVLGHLLAVSVRTGCAPAPHLLWLDALLIRRARGRGSLPLATIIALNVVVSTVVRRSHLDASAATVRWFATALSLVRSARRCFVHLAAKPTASYSARAHQRVQVRCGRFDGRSARLSNHTTDSLPKSTSCTRFPCKTARFECDKLDANEECPSSVCTQSRLGYAPTVVARRAPTLVAAVCARLPL